MATAALSFIQLLCLQLVSDTAALLAGVIVGVTCAHRLRLICFRCCASPKADTYFGAVTAPKARAAIDQCRLFAAVGSTVAVPTQGQTSTSCTRSCACSSPRCSVPSPAAAATAA
jgi:hypothetical protein